MAASSIAVHENSKIMFHGAYADTIAGAEAHEDAADLLRKINADIKRALTVRTSLSPDVVDGWMAEGRMGWLTAEEAMQAGLASKVIGSIDEPLQFADADVASFGERGLKIAALLDVAQSEQPQNGAENAETQEGENNDSAGITENTDTTSEASAGDRGAQEGDGSVAPATGDESSDGSGQPSATAGTSEQGEQQRNATEDARQIAEASATAKYAEMVTALRAELVNAQKNERKMQSERDALRSELEATKNDYEKRITDLAAKLSESTSRLDRYVVEALTFSPAINTWEEAVKACGGDTVEAAKKYKTLQLEYIERKKLRR